MGWDSGKGMMGLPSVPAASVILACPAPAPVPASCLSTGRQQLSCRAGKWPPPTMATCPSKATGQKEVQIQRGTTQSWWSSCPAFWILCSSLLSFVIHCRALTEWCRSRLLRVFAMVPFQSQDRCGGRMYPAEHTEQLWPAPNTTAINAGYSSNKNPYPKPIVLLILTGLSMRQNPH